MQQEDFPPLPHRNTFLDSNSTSTSTIPPLYQTQLSSSSTHQPIGNGYTSSQPSQSQHSQSQSPISFKTSIDTLSNLIGRHQTSVNTKTNNSTTISSQLSNTSSSSTATNGLPSSTITDQYGLVGLLQIIQQAEKNPDSSMLLNFDLTTLGLSMFFAHLKNKTLFHGMAIFRYGKS